MLCLQGIRIGTIHRNIPVSSRQKNDSIPRFEKTQADPLTKDGIVGAFCRAYPIQEAINTFFNGCICAEQLKSERYDYIPGRLNRGSYSL